MATEFSCCGSPLRMKMGTGGHDFSRAVRSEGARGTQPGVSAFLRTPGTHAYVTNAPRRGRGELLQPLPGCISLFLFYPGVRFAHPRLISLRPAGAEFARLKSWPPVFSQEARRQRDFLCVSAPLWQIMLPLMVPQLRHGRRNAINDDVDACGESRLHRALQRRRELVRILNILAVPAQSLRHFVIT